MSLLPNNDLDDYVDTFRSVFLKQSSSKRNVQELLLFIEQISRELEISRENEKCSNTNLKVIVDNKDINIVNKYTVLEEKCNKIETENIDLKIQIEELGSQMKKDLEVQVNEHLRKIKELEENSKSEIEKLQNRIENDTLCFETKERELNNELQLAQANTALQCDEIESHLKRQLVDVTSKLRQSQNSTRAIQLEVTNLRSQLETQRKANNDLRNRLLYFNESSVTVIKNNLNNNEATYRKSNIGNLEENVVNFDERPPSRQSDHSYIKPIQSSLNTTGQINLQSTLLDDEMLNKSEQQTYSEKKSSKNFTDYTPLPVTYKNSTASSKSVGYNPPVIYKGPTSKKNVVPPLMPCSTSNTTKKTNQRKRKLYNPDNFDYLELLSEK